MASRPWRNQKGPITNPGCLSPSIVVSEEEFRSHYGPDDVYRTLYYLNNSIGFLECSSFIVHCMGEHLEGLLKLFPGAHEKLALGAQTKQLKGKVLPADLADKLLEFNKVADSQLNIPLLIRFCRDG